MNTDTRKLREKESERGIAVQKYVGNMQISNDYLLEILECRRVAVQQTKQRRVEHCFGPGHTALGRPVCHNYSSMHRHNSIE
jgi:hypothetical protein